MLPTSLGAAVGFCRHGDFYIHTGSIIVVKIRLKRLGAIHRPYYRIVVIDSRKARNGRAIEEIGYYHPVEKENQLKLSKERAEHWIGQGARPSATVKRLLNQSSISLQ